MLELKNISKSYGTQLILNNINISVQNSQLVSILGPSGSGKSTLLQLIGLLSMPDYGDIHLNDISYKDLKENQLAKFRNENIGFVFQFHNLLGEFTSEENIKLPLYIREKNISEEQEAYFQEIIHHLGIQNLIHKFPSQLSGGEQQRVAVARALINKPALILADEPTGNLDNKNADALYEMFVRLKENYGQQIIMVTHNESLTSQSDQVIYLNSGNII
ncbi:ABC transporter ATP-binding protein [Aquirufa sp. 5-AUSEE-100C1]